MKTDKTELNAIFPKGEAGPAENFTGKAWNIGLVEDDTTFNTGVGNVYFEPGPEATGIFTRPGRS
jgi:quercetin dioxygenase-like cupin family protein